LQLDRSGRCRLAIANHNVPKILGSVLGLLADADINVVDMLNKSRDEIAYNLIDLGSEVSPALLEQLRAIEGVINVRLIQW
jgi:D-3-phosphoglycerate dehydrogenase